MILFLSRFFPHVSATSYIMIFQIPAFRLFKVRGWDRGCPQDVEFSTSLAFYLDGLSYIQSSRALLSCNCISAFGSHLVSIHADCLSSCCEQKCEDICEAKRIGETSGNS